MISLVNDRRDPRIADFVDLADPAARRRRERDELFIAEGFVAVARLLESGHAVRSILVSAGKLARLTELLGDREVTVHVAESDVIEATVGFNLHRGVVASATRRPLPTLDDVLARSRRIVVLEGLNDPENLGLIARTARAFGVDALVLDPTCIDPYYRRVVRVSMGEVLLLDVARSVRWPAALDDISASGFETWAMTPAADAADIWTLAVPDRIGLVFGAEGTGLSAAAMDRAGRRVRIPISPEVDSINVGHAAAAALAIVGRG